MTAPHIPHTNTATSSTSQTSLTSHFSSENGSSPPGALPPHYHRDTNTPPPSMTKQGISEVDGPETLVSTTEGTCPTLSGPQESRAVVQLPTVPEAGRVHLEYLENLIRDSNEDMRFAINISYISLRMCAECKIVTLCYYVYCTTAANRLAVHRDIRALGLDMLRQFLMLQVNMGQCLY